MGWRAELSAQAELCRRRLATVLWSLSDRAVGPRDQKQPERGPGGAGSIISCHGDKGIRKGGDRVKGDVREELCCTAVYKQLSPLCQTPCL